MKKTSLSLTKQKKDRHLSLAETFSLLLPAATVIVGFWSMVSPVLQTGLLLPVILSLAAAALTLWIGRSSKKYIWPLILLCSALLLCLILRQPLQDSLGEMLNRISLWLTEKTGIYHLPYRTQGSVLPMLIVCSLILGTFVGLLVQCRNPFWILLLLPALLPAAAHMVSAGWGLTIYLLGCVLMLCVSASGTGKPLVAAALVVAVFSGIFGGIFSAIPLPAETTGAGEALMQHLHDRRYEPIKNPMPEGKLADLPSYAPSNESALEVTMDHWTTLYLRGYVGSVYTQNGWKPTAPQDAAQNAPALYALQKDGFFPALQLDAGWQETDIPCENSVTVKTMGACHAYTYLPYGAGAPGEMELDPAQLVGEGTMHPHSQTLTASLRPVEKSYILQDNLSKMEDSPYLQAEAVYRKWVYDTFLALPEDVQALLQDYMDPDGKALSTTQAKVEITRLLENLLTYNEATRTKSGDYDFAAYVMQKNPKGYSVHYATLATLLMRSCGIPARYVEGYVVTPAQAQVMSDGETMILRQTNSHAWCEYYLDGVGWIPFDATPGYTDTLDYELPENGIPSEDDQGGGHLQQPDASQKPHDKPLPVDQKPDAEGLSHWVYIRQALSLLGIMLLLALLALAARSLVLRRRLRKQQAHFTDPDPRLASGYILCYSTNLLELLGLAPKNMTLSQRKEEIGQILQNQENLQQIIDLSDEIWFSSHPITEQQRQAALQWMTAVTELWQKNTPPVKRWLLRWLHCRVL